jgi:hypothetical protein
LTSQLANPGFIQILNSLLATTCGETDPVGSPSATAAVSITSESATPTRAGWRAAMLIDGLKIEIVGLDGSPLRRLVLDPTKDYQRIP